MPTPPDQPEYPRNMHGFSHRTALNITLIYTLFGSFWILFSDQTMALLVNDQQLLVLTSMFKGWFYVLCTSGLLFFLINRAVSHLHEAQKDLHRSQVILESVGEAIIATDLKGRVEFMNPVAQRLTGWPLEEARGLPIEEVFVIINEGTREPAKNPVRLMLDRGQGVGHTNHTLLVARDGLEHPINYSGAPVFDQLAVISGVVLVFRDVSAERVSTRALEANEARYRLLTEQAGDWVFWLDAQGRHLYDSPACRVMTGFDPVDFACDQELLLHCIHEADRHLYREHITRQHNHLASPLEFRIVHRDGSVRWLSHTCHPLLDDQGRLLGRRGCHRDISLQKKAEIALQTQKDLLHAIIEGIEDAIFVKDLQGRYKLCNKATGKFLGMPQDSILEHDDRDIFPEDLATRIMTLDQEIMQEARGRTMQQPLIMADGRSYIFQVSKGPIFDASGRVKGIFGISRDITAQIHNLEKLRDNEERLRLVIESAAEGFWMIDPGLQTIEVNASLCRMLGYAKEEMLGRPPTDFTDDANRRIFTEQLAKLPSTASQRHYEIELQRKDGTNLPLYFQATTCFKDNEVQMAFAFITDLTPIRQAERSLRQELERSQRYLDTVEVMLVALDSEGTITLINRKGCEILGYHSDELLGRSWFATCLPQPEGMEQVFPVFHQIISGQAATVEYFENQVLNRDGQTRLVAWHNTVIRDATGRITGVLSAGEDITEERRLEGILRDTTNRFRRLVQCAPVPMCHVAKDGEITYTNDRFYQLFGWTPEDLPTMARAWTRLFPDPEQRKMAVTLWDEAVARAVREQSDILVPEYDIHCKNNTIRKVEVTGILLDDGVLLAFTDQTERREAEEANRRLALAVEQVSSSVVITGPDGAIQYVNPAFEAVSGYSRQEVLGQNPRILKSDSQDERFYQKLWQTISSGRTWEGRLINKRKDGNLFTEEATISPVRDAAGTIINYVAVKRDITDELARQDEQESLRAQLQQAQKLESVGRLAGGVAHDFNNKLGVILGYVEILLLENHCNDSARKTLEEIRSATLQSADLTRQLLAFARRQTVMPKRLDLNESIDSLLKMLRRLIGEDISLVWIPASDLAPVLLDPAQLDQILANLAINARDAMGSDGKLTIETANVSIDRDYCALHPEAQPGDFVLLAVSDNGCGMDQELLGKIFEPFFTTKGVGEGTGLGLATVYGIVKQNKGLIDVYSEPGRGTSFKLYFPSLAGSPQEAERQSGTRPVPHGSETILLVEDEEGLRKLAEEMLRQLGYRVLLAKNAEEAMERLAGGEEVPLLLCDVVLPVTNGRELSERITRLRPGIKTLFMSGYTANVIAHHGVLDAGINFLAKPFTISALATAIRQILDEPRADSSLL